MKNKFFSIILLSAVVISISAQTSPQLGKAPLKNVISAMTLEEKAALVVGARYRNPNSQNASNNQLPVSPVPLTQGAAGFTYAVPRLGIPPIVLADGPAGLRISPTRQNDNNTYYCTAFPVATLLASTWDSELATSVGKAMGNEVLEYGVDVILGPALNIHRNPLCGRNFEYFSEDPLITGKIAASMVNGIQSNGVGTSIKHFAANNAETNRMSLNTIVSERALREIYLKGFSIAVKESKPWTVMSSYNLINGVYASESNDLLTKILRNDWNYGGFVMTDWGGGKDPVAQMIAGNDLLMPGNASQSKTIVDAVNSGKLDVKILDKNVERILNIVLMSPKFRGYNYSNKPDLKAHALVTRQAADEGMVLLKNSGNALPLPEATKKIAAFGNTSYEIITGGTGSGDVNEAYSIALVEGLNNAGLTVNENLQSLYNSYLKSVKEGKPRGRGFMGASASIAEFAVNSDIAASMANVADAALITIGRNSGEGSDRKPEEGDFQLTASERELIRQVSDAFHAKNKKVVVVLNIGGVIETASWKEIPDAILLAWQAGQETGNSIADILCGKVNPSGKLASTFPVNYSDVSSAGNFPGKVTPQTQVTDSQNPGPRRQQSEVSYEEGIYVGYRYYTTFKIPVSYEFGYGLSYSTFGYSNLKLSSSKFGKSITVSVDIKNTGTVAGKEVAELYLGAPAGKLDKPERELKGFAKTTLLQPGEVQNISFMIDASALASFDTQSSSWIAEAGRYIVNVGASSADIRATGTFTLGSTMVVKKESKALACSVTFNELKLK
jgi:beta-glucosidase